MDQNFPSGNRNAGGAQFFKYILSNSSTSDEVFEKNKMYCAVSGSLIRPGSQPEFISVVNKDSKGLNAVHYIDVAGRVHGVMKYVSVEQLEVTFSDTKS